MPPFEYVVVPHMNGSLAIQVSSVTSLWFLPASPDKAAQLRIQSRALSDAKTLTGEDADGVWATFQARTEDFVFAGHMGGTLAIPRAQIRTAYYSEDGGAPRLRLTYDGDPSGKTLDGDDAVRIWSEIRNQP